VNTLLGIIVFLGTFWAALWLARKVATGNRIFVICLGTSIFFSLAIINSRILSVYGSLSSYLGWIGLTIICCGLCYFVDKRVRPTLVGDSDGSVLAGIWTWYMPEGKLSKLAVFFSAYFAFVIAVQLLDILILPPSQWDSFTYIMPRVLFYLQNGNLNPYTTNDLAQIAHVTGWSQIQAFGLLITGRREFGFSIFSLALFCVGLLATMESGRILSGKALGGWISGFVYATAVNVINLSSTPQSDMPIAGFLACGLLGLIVWIDKLNSNVEELTPWVFSVFVAGSFALAAVMKASALLALASCSPIILLLLWNLLLPKRKDHFKNVVSQFLLGIGVALVIFLCGGYYSNFKNFGHPLGSIEWRDEHEFSNSSLNEQIKEGSKNLGRYLVHFISLDGFYTGPHGVANSIIRKIQMKISTSIEALFNSLGIDLHIGKQRYPFQYYSDHKPVSNSDQSFTGVFFVVCLMLSLYLILQKKAKMRLWGVIISLFGSALLYLILQSYLAIYDPWRGRSFSNIIIFLAPICSIIVCILNKSYSKYIVYFLLSFGAVQGVSAIVFRDSGPLIATRPDQSTIFNPGDRASQFARFIIDKKEYYQFRNTIKNFNWLKSEGSLGINIDGAFLVYPFICNFNHFSYIEPNKKFSNDDFDTLITSHAGVKTSQSFEIGEKLYLWTKTQTVPYREENDFDSFFGLEKHSGIGQLEGPYGKNGLPFRLMTSPHAELQFNPIANDSTLIIEASSIEVPNQIEVYVDEKLLGKIDLIKKGKIYKFSSDLETAKNEAIKVDLKASNGFDDKYQSRVIYSFIYKTFLFPKSKQKL
jgi:hypothetical protein